MEKGNDGPMLTALRPHGHEPMKKIGEGQGAHALHGPSSAYRYLNCPGSINATLSLPEPLRDQSSDAAEEGSGAHALAERCLKTGEDPDQHRGRWMVKIGEEYELSTVRAPDTYNWPIDDDMIDAVSIYLTYAEERWEGREAWIEQRVQFLDRDTCWGTSDLILYEPMGELLVVDYKHGRGIPVTAEENTQLKCYGLGALRAVGEFDVETVKLAVVQPRCHKVDPIQEWEISPGELIEWGDTLDAAVALTEDPGAPRIAGDWCQFCPFATKCPERIQRNLSMAKWEAFDEASLHELEGGEVTVEMVRPDLALPEEIGKALFLAREMREWIKDVERAAYNAARKGVKLPGLKMVRGSKHRQWEDEALVREKLKNRRYKIDDVAPRKMRSPSQIEKLIGGKEGKTFVRKHAYTPQGDLKLVSEEDPRDEAPLQLPQFSPVAEGEFESETGGSE